MLHVLRDCPTRWLSKMGACMNLLRTLSSVLKCLRARAHAKSDEAADKADKKEQEKTAAVTHFKL